MNNIVFNDTAQNLKVQLYGITTGGTVTAIQTDANGNLNISNVTVVAGSMTVMGGTMTVVGGTMTVVGGTMTMVAGTIVAGTMTVVGGTMTVVGGTMTMVAGTIVAGTMTVVGGTMTVEGGTMTVVGGTMTVVGGTMTVVGGTVSALIAGNGFYSLSATLQDVGTDTTFAFTTTSYKTQSFYIYNTGALSVSARIQVSPLNDDTYFVNDRTSEVQIGADQGTILIPGVFMNFTRLRVQGSNTATCIVYYNAQY